MLEAKEKVLNSQVWVKEEIYLGYRKPEFHFSIHDSQAGSIVVQFVNNGTINIYNNDLGVATNNPEYSWHVDKVKNYFTLDNHSISEKTISGVNYKALGQGNGFRGIPGDYSSPSRFIKMAYLLNYVAEWTNNSDDAIINAGAILANAEIPKGAVVSGILGIDLLPELTLWKVLKDLKNNALYVKSYKSLGYVKFDLTPVWDGTKELNENVVNIISSNN